MATATWEPYEGARVLILQGPNTSNLTWGMVGQISHNDAADPNIWWVEIKCGGSGYEGHKAPVHVTQLASLTEAEQSVRQVRAMMAGPVVCHNEIGR